MPLDADVLNELKRQVASASPGPWRYHEMSLALFKNHNQPIAERVSPEDGAFLVAARESVAQLIEEVERLRAEIRRHREK